jgi:hypothetical protein
MHFHPPGYPVMLAAVYEVLDDWMKTGLLVSWMSMMCVLLASYGLFRRVGGSYAALGGLGGLAVSDVFLAWSAGDIRCAVPRSLDNSTCPDAGALDAGGQWRWLAVGVVVPVSSHAPTASS